MWGKQVNVGHMVKLKKKCLNTLETSIRIPILMIILLILSNCSNPFKDILFVMDCKLCIVCGQHLPCEHYSAAFTGKSSLNMVRTFVLTQKSLKMGHMG